MVEVLIGIDVVSVIFSLITLIRLRRTMPEFFTNLNTNTISQTPASFYTLSPSYEPRGRQEVTADPPQAANHIHRVPIIHVMEYEEHWRYCLSLGLGLYIFNSLIFSAMKRSDNVRFLHVSVLCVVQRGTPKIKTSVQESRNTLVFLFCLQMNFTIGATLLWHCLLKIFWIFQPVTWPYFVEMGWRMSMML